MSVKKNFIDKTNPKMVAMREKLQNQIGLRDGTEDKELFYDRE